MTESGSLIKSVELYDLVKRRSDSTYDCVVYNQVKTESLELQAEGEEVKHTKPGNAHCDWFILPLLLPTQTIWFSLGHKQDKATES